MCSLLFPNTSGVFPLELIEANITFVESFTRLAISAPIAVAKIKSFPLACKDCAIERTAGRTKGKICGTGSKSTACINSPLT